MDGDRTMIPIERVTSSILLIRGQKVILDSDLATLYGVETRTLLQAVKRNHERFPGDFMFQLNAEESEFLRQRVDSTVGRGGRRYAPYAFTEQGVAMLSGVLNSPRAIAVNVAIMRAFVKLRQLLTDNEKLARKLRAMEKKYDGQFKIVFDAIRAMMEPVVEPAKKGRIGFKAD